ncbi:MAG: methyltransferase [Candidatus Hodarchaeales archaeon]
MTNIFHEKAFLIHSLISMTLWSVNGLMVIALQLTEHPTLLNNQSLSILGNLLLVIGVIIGLWGYLTLGMTRSLHYNFFAQMKSENKVVTTGIYSYIKDPEYLGLFLILLGLTLASDSFYNFLIFVEFSILLIPLKIVEDKPLKGIETFK